MPSLILSPFVFGRHFAIEHLYLSSSIVFQYNFQHSSKPSTLAVIVTITKLANMNTETLTSKSQQDIWTIMQQINHCWYKGQPSQLADYFHDNIVFNGPDLKQQFTGKDICIQSYIDFLNCSKILLYKEANPVVHIFGSTAIVSYYFEMKYEQKDKVYHETGTDIMVFNKYANSWKAVWRSLANLKSA